MKEITKQVTFNDKPGTSSSNTQKHEVHQKVQQTNVHVIHSTTEVSGSKPRSNTKKNRILPAKTKNKKKVEEFTLGKLDCGYQWRPTGKKFALGEMCHLTNEELLFHTKDELERESRERK
ncbi:hypothetical protein Tco_0426931 [Tanacetum coccineum]